MDILTRGFVNTAQCRFFYVEAGRGPAVLLLHGGASSHHEWSQLVPWLTSGNRVIVPDRPGCGQSARPREGYGRTTQGRAIVELVKALGEERVAVVGHGLGGFLAIELAAAFPYAVSRLVLISPVAGGLEGQSRTLTAEEALAERQLYGEGALDLIRAADARQRYSESLREYAAGSDPNATREMMADAGRARDGMSMRSFRCPTLIVKPVMDHTLSAERARRMAELIPLGSYVELPDVGHFAHVERPDVVAEAIVPFLRER